MARKRRAARPTPTANSSTRERRVPAFTPAALLLAAAIVFYWIPLTDPNTTPQWDAVDHRMSAQRYFVDETSAGRLPWWTDYTGSGFPFLADPRHGGWYPLNWPFFLSGIMPKTMYAEAVLHCVLALIGMWLLAGRWMSGTGARVIAAVFYGFSGYFAGHANYTDRYQTAALLPLCLYLLHRAMESPSARRLAASGAAGGMLLLAGYYPNALYGYGAMVLYAAAFALTNRAWREAGAAVASTAALGLAISAIQWMPASALAAEALHGAAFGDAAARLSWQALTTLVHADAMKAVSTPYNGQSYFYAGALLLPLSALGLAARGPLLRAALPLVALAAGYAAFYTAAAAPVHIWFVAALALALLAGAGASWLHARLPRPWLLPCIGVVLFADVFYFNLYANHQVYDRMSFQQRYGVFQDLFETNTRKMLPPGTRYHTPAATPAYGPLNNSLDLRIPVTYITNPLQLRRYSAYFDSIPVNPKLMNGLNVGLYTGPNGLVDNEFRQPRFYFPRALRSVADEAASRAALPSIVPAEGSVVEGPIGRLRQDPAAKVEVLAAGQADYRLRYAAASPSLLRVAIPYVPGWEARKDGAPLPIRVVDHAVFGIEVPTGSGEIALRFRQPRFWPGAALSVLASLAAAALLLRPRAPA